MEKTNIDKYMEFRRRLIIILLQFGIVAVNVLYKIVKDYSKITSYLEAKLEVIARRLRDWALCS